MRRRFWKPRQRNPSYLREVRKLSVPDVRVTTDALVLQVHSELTVK